MDDKYDTEKLFLEECDYSVSSENKEELTDKKELTDVPPKLPLEGDEEEVKAEKGLKLLIRNKLLNRFFNIINTKELVKI